MANPLRGEVPLQGTDYILRFDLNALCEAEAESGENLAALLSTLSDGTPPSFRTLRLLLWAGMRSSRPGMTLADAGSAAQDVGIAATMQSLEAAFNASFGKSEGDAEKNQ